MSFDSKWIKGRSKNLIVRRTADIFSHVFYFNYRQNKNAIVVGDDDTFRERSSFAGPVVARHWITEGHAFESDVFANFRRFWEAFREVVRELELLVVGVLAYF